MPLTERKMARPAPRSADDERRLAMMRDSAWRVGDRCATHLHLMLRSLDIDDDLAAGHHAKHAVEAMRGVAQLVNEILDLRDAAPKAERRRT